MKLIFSLLISIILVGCYTPIKVQNLGTHTTDIIDVDEDFASLLSSGDTVVFNEYNSDLKPSEAFVGVVTQEALAITLDISINPITGDTIPSGTILPCVSNKNSGDIIYVAPLDGDVYVETYDGIRCVFVK